MYHVGINPGQLLYLQSLEYSINARTIMGKKSILATEIAIPNAIKQNRWPSSPSLSLTECILSCQRIYQDKHSMK